MNKKKVVTHKFYNTGVVVNKETGEMIEPDTDKYMIEIQNFYEEPESNDVKFANGQ